MLQSTFDYLEGRVPFGSKLISYGRRLRADLRTLLRTFVRWKQLESQCDWLGLETINVCNANCVFCAYQYQAMFRKGHGVMSDVIFRKAVEDFQAMGGRAVGFTPMVGEALLDPNLTERLGFVKSLGLSVSFHTNGIRFNHIDINAFLNTGVDLIVVSTAPFNRAIYEAVYRNDHYSDLLEGLEQLLKVRNELRSAMPVQLAFRSPISRRESLAQPDFQQRILPHLTGEERKQLFVNTRGFDTWGGLIKQEALPGMMRLALPPSIKCRPCAFTFAPLVLWDGRIRACGCRFTGSENADGEDGLLVGNLNHSSLQEIWYGPEVKRFRRRFVNGSLPTVCRNCTMYKAC
jgi:MoaA/NifB/PqqE/SkfB family radical SAM enzyme